MNHRSGFTLVESLVALTLMMLAGAAILLSVDATVSTSEISVDETIAAGIARQLVDEAMGKRYVAVEGNPYQVSLGPSGWEQSGSGRERYNDIDDFNGFATVGGAKNIWGVALGEGDDAGGTRHASFKTRSNYFSNWRQEVDVYYVDEDDLSQRLGSGETSDYRAIEVRVLRRDTAGVYQPLATVRRIHVHVPRPN